MLGKIKKWLTDLGAAAFRSVANNLTTASEGAAVLDAYQGKLLNDKIGLKLEYKDFTFTSVAITGMYYTNVDLPSDAGIRHIVSASVMTWTSPSGGAIPFWVMVRDSNIIVGSTQAGTTIPSLTLRIYYTNSY